MVFAVRLRQLTLSVTLLCLLQLAQLVVVVIQVQSEGGHVIDPVAGTVARRLRRLRAAERGGREKRLTDIEDHVCLGRDQLLLSYRLDGCVVEVVPASVCWVFAVCSIVAVTEVARVITDSEQVVDIVESRLVKARATVVEVIEGTWREEVAMVWLLGMVTVDGAWSTADTRGTLGSGGRGVGSARGLGGPASPLSSVEGARASVMCRFLGATFAMFLITLFITPPSLVIWHRLLSLPRESEPLPFPPPSAHAASQWRLWNFAHFILKVDGLGGSSLGPVGRGEGCG